MLAVLLATLFRGVLPTTAALRVKLTRWCPADSRELAITYRSAARALIDNMRTASFPLRPRDLSRLSSLPRRSLARQISYTSSHARVISLPGPWHDRRGTTRRYISSNLALGPYTNARRAAPNSRRWHTSLRSILERRRISFEVLRHPQPSIPDHRIACVLGIFAIPVREGSEFLCVHLVQVDSGELIST